MEKSMKNISHRLLVKNALTAFCLFGTAKYAFSAVCTTCDGSGTGPFECFHCKGSGKLNGFKCSFCNGKGFVKCGSCNGTGQKK